MLDPQGRFTLAELPGLLLFPDDRMAEGFYALPAQPRIARDEAGQPQISLTLYGRKRGEDFVATGGLLSLTVSLALTQDEEAGLDAALRRRLAERAAGQGTEQGAPAKAPVRLSVDWLTAEVEVRLIPDLRLTGKPSMSGANVCSFSANLAAATAEALQKAWADGLRDAAITYRTSVRSAPRAATTFQAKESSERVGSGGAVYGSSSSEVSFSAQPAPAAPYPLELSGPLSLAPQELAGRVSTLSLG